MTGIYLRVKRDGKFQNVEIDQMTDAELDDMQRRATNPDAAWMFMKALSRWIRDNVREPEDQP